MIPAEQDSMTAFLRGVRTESISAPDVSEQLRAAFQRENTVSLALQALERPTFDPEEGFDPLDHMTFEELANPALRQGLMGARSRAELEWLKERFRQLQQLDALIENGPLGGIAARFIAGLIDPINLVPLGWVARGVRAAGFGRSLVAQGAAVGAAAAGSVEVFKQAADPFRTLGDALLDISVGAAFGAGIGALGASLARRNRVVEAYATILPREEAEVMAKAASDAYANAVKVAAEAGQPGPSTVGARFAPDEGKVVREVLRDELLSVAGPKWVQRLVASLGRTVSFFRYPSAALLTSPFATARRFAWALDDPGILSRAALQQVDEKALERLYPKAQQAGFSGSLEEFKEIARREISTGLPVTEFGTWRTNRALLDAMADTLKDAVNTTSRQAVKEGLVKTREEFAEAVGQHMRFLEEPHRFGGVSPIAHNPKLMAIADELAKVWKKTIADPMLDAIKQSGIWADTPKTQEAILRELRGSYFPKVFSREKIAADPAGFAKAMEDALTDAVKAAKDRYETYQRMVRYYETYNKDLKNWLKNVDKNPQGKAAVFIKLIEALIKARMKLEEARAEILKSTSKPADDWRRAFEEQLASGYKAADWELQLKQQYDNAYSDYIQESQYYNAFRVANLSELVKAAKGFQPPPSLLFRPQAYDGIEKDRALLFGKDGSGVGLITPEAIRAEAVAITEKLMGGDPHMQIQAGLRAYLKGRQTDIDPQRFLPWLETNFLRAAEHYVSSLARDLPLYQIYGTYKIEDYLARLTDEATRMIEEAQKAGNKELADRLAKERQLAAEMISELWAGARGTADVAKTRGGQIARQAAANAQSLAFMAYMGSGVIPQLGDMTTAVLSFGVKRAIPNMMEELGAIVTRSTDRLTKEQLSKLAVAGEHAAQARMRALYDIAPAEHAGPITQAIQKTTTIFSRLTLMPMLNDFFRRAGVRLADDLLTENIPKILAGKSVNREFSTVASIAGVTQKQLETMAKLLSEYRATVDPKAKLWDSNLEAWFFRDPDVGQAYRRLLHVTAQRMLITPGLLDSPIWSQRTLGRLVLLFKRFMVASVPKIMVPWLQSPAGRKFEVFFGGLVIGGIVTVLRDLNREGKIKERNAQSWFFEAMDMSGLFSGLTELDATVNRIVPGFSIKQQLTGEDYSRWQERQWLFGSGEGRFAELLGVGTRYGGSVMMVGGIPYAVVTRGEPTERQVRAAREILPFQNHFLFRHGFDMLEQWFGGRRRSWILQGLED